MDPRRESPEVFSKTIERAGRKGFVDEESETVRHLAYTQDTPPKYATRPTAWALRAYSISGVDARIITSGGVKYR